MSTFVRTWTIYLLFMIKCFSVVEGNAMLRPVSRGLMWTRRNQVPTNYNYMGVNCGGIARYRRNDGQCGLCGDPFDGPRRHEFGGKFATGAIAQTFAVGKKAINVKILINANQGGFIEFRLCRANGQPETEACFNENLLLIKEAVHQGETDRYYVENTGLLHLNLDIPKGLSCKQCVLQWKYTTDNMWGRDAQGQGCLGCGHQETFINCADIRIKGWNVPPTRPPTLPSTTTTTTTTMSPQPTTTTARTTVVPTTQRLTTQRPPQTTIYVPTARNRTDKDEGRRSITPSWTQSGNKVTNSAPKTPLDLHNLALERQRPMGTRGPPPRPPPSNIPRPPKLSSQHIDALNANGKLHVHSTGDKRPYIHIHSSQDNKPYLYSAPPTTTAASTRNSFDRQRNEYRGTSHDFNHHRNNNHRQSQRETTLTSRNNNPGQEKQQNGGRSYNEYTFTKLPSYTVKTTNIPASRSFTRASSFDQRAKSSFNKQRGSFNRQESGRNYRDTPEPRTKASSNWYSRTTTSTPKRQVLPQKIKTPERNRHSRYGLANTDKFNKQPIRRQSHEFRGIAKTKKTDVYRGMVLDPMGEPITSTSTTPQPTTQYSRFVGPNRAIPMSRELKTMYNLRNQLKADAEENRFRKPVVFERFTQFRIGKKGRPRQEAYVGGEKVLRVMAPSNELSKPFQNPSYMSNPSKFSETNVSTNMLGINPQQGQDSNAPASIHGVDFLGQKPQRNEFAHRKHTNTLHKESIPRETNFQRNGGHLPIVAMHDGHPHSNVNSHGVRMNGVLGLYSQEDKGSVHHRIEMTPSTTTTTSTTTMSPFHRQHLHQNFGFSNVNPQKRPSNQFIPNNRNHFPQPFANGVPNANKQTLNSIPDIQIQSGQVFEKTMPPVRNDQMGGAIHQFQPTNQVGNGMQGIDPLVEHLKSQILASVNMANSQMQGYNTNQFHPQPMQNLQTMQRANNNPNIIPNTWQQGNNPFPHPNINPMPAMHNVHQTPNMNDLSFRLLQNQAIPQAPSSYVFPNIKTQNLFSSHGLKNLFPNNGALHELQDQKLQLVLDSLAQQSTTPEVTTEAKPTTVQTQPTTTPTTTTETTTTTTTKQPTTKATFKSSTLDLETATSKELFQELKKFQEVMKKRPLNYDELQRQQALQTQLLKKLYEDQMKRMDTQYSSDKKSITVKTPPTTAPTSTTAYPRIPEVQSQIDNGKKLHRMKQQTHPQSEIYVNSQNNAQNTVDESHMWNKEQINRETTTEKITPRNYVRTTSATLPEMKTQNAESVGQVSSSQTAGPDRNERNKNGALQNRLDKFVNTLANRMNTKVSEAGATGKLQNVNVAPVSRDAIMKVLREMALDAMRKKKQNQGRKPMVSSNQTRPRTDVSRSSTNSKEERIARESERAMFSERLVDETIAVSPNKIIQQMSDSPPAPPFVRQDNAIEKTQINHLSEESSQLSLKAVKRPEMQVNKLRKNNDMIHQGQQRMTQASEQYNEGIGQEMVANQDFQVHQLHKNSHIKRNKVPQTLEELRKQQIPVFKPLTTRGHMEHVVKDSLTTRNSKPRQYRMLWDPPTTPIKTPAHNVNFVTNDPSTKLYNRPVESVTETTSFTVRHNTHFKDNKNLQNFADAFNKPNQKGELVGTTNVLKSITETVTVPTKTPTPTKKKLTQKAITDLGNEIMLQMKRLLARRNG